MQINFNKFPLQPRWPLVNSPVYGPYDPILESRESIQQNFVFLLKTIPGEWPMNPDLGVGLATYLFETYNSAELATLKSNLKNQLKKYLPSVKLVDAEFISDETEQDGLTTLLQITYVVDLLGVLETIDFGLDSITKTFVQVRPRESKIGRVL